MWTCLWRIVRPLSAFCRVSDATAGHVLVALQLVPVTIALPIICIVAYQALWGEYLYVSLGENKVTPTPHPPKLCS